MKTTIDLSEDLLAAAKALAAEEGRTLRSLVEEGLRWVLGQRRKARDFRLEDASVPGKGLQAGVREGGWEGIRDLIFRGRGT